MYFCLKLFFKMRKHLITVLLALTSIMTFGQQWVGIKSDTPATIQTTLVSSSESSITVSVQVAGFYAIEVNTPRGAAQVISVPKTVSTSEAGEPDLPTIAIPVLIGDYQHYDIRVLEAQYTDYQMEITPSKGDFSRQIDPKDVPYTYGEAYSTDAFFPAQNVNLYEPYILRDFRGQNMVVYPFAYNPISKTLRVYYNMTVEMYSDDQEGENQLTRKSTSVKMDSEFEALYSNHFINYSESASKYNPVNENGHLLIICHDEFIDAMQPFVEWKKQIGRPTTIVGTSITGTTCEAIKAYILEQYSANGALTHVLFVGDAAQIPGNYVPNGNYSGKSDNWYGQVVGNDFYNDLIIGRFSAENTTQVTTQVDKVIHYERDINASDTWLTKGCGVSASAGNGGHYGEDDYVHIENLRTDLLGYHYSTVYQEYYGVTGYNSNTQQISTRVNSGVSIINYCNHGNQTSWQSHNPWYSSTYVNALTNDNMLPIIFSVACLNGQYDYSQPCFAEAWMRAKNNSTGNPTGAIGGMFSYISQPWVPPMYAQDEMVDILVESYSNNIKRTLGGISFDGNMKILDQYSTSNTQAMGTYMCWILYGDPTLTIRNDIPADMDVTHASSMDPSDTTFVVFASNGEGATATLTLDNEILSTGTIYGGNCTLYFDAPGQLGTATLTVFGYNKITYEQTINIYFGGGNDPINMSVSANPEIILPNGSSQLTATASGGNGVYTYSWTPSISLNDPNIATPIATPSSTTTYTCTISSGTETASESCTVLVVRAPTNFTATVENRNNVCLNWNAANPAQSYKIYRNDQLIAQDITETTYLDSDLNPGTYSYQVSTVYEGFESPRSVTKTVTIFAPLSVTVTASETVIYPGTSITLSAQPSGGSGTYTYSWSPANAVNNPTAQTTTTSPLQTTTYTCTVSSAEQTASGSITIIAVTPPAEFDAEIVDEEEVYLTWTEADVVDYYNIYREGVLIADHLIETNFTDYYVFWGNVCYEVRAIYQDVYSDPASDCVFFCAPPIMVQTEYIWNHGDFFVRISWKKDVFVNTEVDKFKVFRSLNDYGDFELIGEVENEDYVYDYQFNDTTATIGSYGYMVSATYKFYDCEEFSDPVSCNVTYLQEHNTSVKVYPNPTKGEITLEGKGLSHVRIVNAYDQTVYNADLEGEQTRIDLSRMAKGIYMMHINTANGQAIRKVVVE